MLGSSDKRLTNPGVYKNKFNERAFRRHQSMSTKAVTVGIALGRFSNVSFVAESLAVDLFVLRQKRNFG